jgi:hypothetical protein
VDILLINERRVRQIKGDPEEALHFLMDKGFQEKYKLYYAHYKDTPSSLSEITMFVHKDYNLEKES